MKQVILVILFYFIVNGQDYEEINCDDTVTGRTSPSSPTENYTLTLSNGPQYITIVSCGSDYDTYLYLYDDNGDIVDSCDDCGSCGLRTVLEIDNQLDDGDYTLVIAGFSTSIGDYEVDILCDTDSQPELDYSDYTTSTRGPSYFCVFFK